MSKRPSRDTTVEMNSPLTNSRKLVPVSDSATLEDRLKAQEKEILKLNLLLDTVESIGTESNLESLVPLIAKRTSQIMDCDRSTLFLVDHQGRELYSLIAEGLESRKLRLPMTEGLAAYVARTGWPLNIPDAYQDERFNPKVDQKTGFRTVSVLGMPLFDRKGLVMGVVQCLNKRDSSGKATPFLTSDEPFLSALAGVFSIFLENAKLNRHMRDLLASIVSSFSRSIDDRDPCTHGHSRRVTMYALNLAKAVHESQAPQFRRIKYTKERVMQLKYAGLLHDVGKIGVREHVLCKADKLPENGVPVIEGRLLLLLEKTRSKVLEAAIEKGEDHRIRLESEYEPLAREIHEALELIRKHNIPGYVSDEDLAALQNLREKKWLTEHEFNVLSIRKGNLTPEEWDDIRSHVTKSYQLLRKIPWPQQLGDIPEIAYTHHEKRDGSGYPRKLAGDAIHWDGQILCVADIYDALTASDRPYKKAMPHDKAMRILVEEEAAQNKMLPELVDLFFAKKCYVIDETDTKFGLPT